MLSIYLLTKALPLWGMCHLIRRSFYFFLFVPVKYHYPVHLDISLRASQTARRVRTLDAKPRNQNLIPRTRMTGENECIQDIFWPLWAITHTQNQNDFYYYPKFHICQLVAIKMSQHSIQFCLCIYCSLVTSLSTEYIVELYKIQYKIYSRAAKSWRVMSVIIQQIDF